MLGGLVISHWLLDALVHRPDLPLSFSEETKVGLGLWNQKAATIGVEIALFLSGSLLYIRTTRPKNPAGRYALGALLLYMVAIYFMNAFGDPPQDVQTLGFAGLAQWLLIAWGYWVDRSRTMNRG